MHPHVHIKQSLTPNKLFGLNSNMSRSSLKNFSALFSSPYSLINSRLEQDQCLVNTRIVMFGRSCEMLFCLPGLFPFWFTFISSGIQNMAQCAMWVSHYFEMVSKHGVSLIRIRAVIMFYYHSNNSMTHFTFSYVNPRISIYNTETNMDWNIVCFSPHSDSLLSSLFLFAAGLAMTLISSSLKVPFHIFAYLE